MGSWAAPSAQAPVQARVQLPGSKSLTNRALVLAALAGGPSRIVAPLRARDTELMVGALHALGAGVEDDGADWVVTPGPFAAGVAGAVDGRHAAVDVGLAGTVMRFVPPLAALWNGQVTFNGDDHALARPMHTLIDGLRQVGVLIDDAGTGALPFVVHGIGRVAGGHIEIDASASSQFVSGLLLAAARFERGLTVLHTGAAAVPSVPHIDMTLAMLRQAGVAAASPRPGEWQVVAGPIAARDWVIEPDLSNAAPFLAAAVVAGGSVTVPGWPEQTTQAGDALRRLLADIGASVTAGSGGLTVTGTGIVKGITADLRDVGELTPTLAAIAALADSPSTFTGIAHLRGHETDRLAALRTELTGLGGDVDETPDGLVIRPAPLHGGTWRAYADHRMATAGAVIGLRVAGVEIDDIESTTKTLPEFAALWTGMLAG